MAMTFDSTNSDNPIAAIEEVHEAFRKNMRNNCSAQVIKLKWVKEFDADKAYNIYLKHAKDNGIVTNWKHLLKKVEEDVLIEFHDVSDDWMLSKLAYFDMEKEIRDAFQFEWMSIGEKPRWFMAQRQESHPPGRLDEGTEKQSPVGP